MSETKTLQQVIEGWRMGPWHNGCGFACMELEQKACADEASLVLERLRGLVRQWRGWVKELELNGQHDAARTQKADADALEQICSPEPSGGDR